MGNPDLEQQNPDLEGPHRRRDANPTTGSFRAVAAGLLLAIGVWALCADATMWSILRLQQQGLITVNSGGEALAVSNLGGSGTGNLVGKAERCAVRNFMKDTSFLDRVEGISTEEFLERRNRLAKVLKDEGVAAFVIEPGFTFEYYANVSKTDWEPFELDERPFLMVIRPEEADDGRVTAKTSFLAPHFEVSRVRMLPIPRAEPELDVVVWEEHWNPYATLRRSRLFPSVAAHNPAEVDQRPWLMVDAEMRSYIVGGLWDAGFRFRDLSPAVRTLPQIKTPAEVAILRGVNAASTAAIRAARPCLVPGMTEDDARRVMRGTLGAAGLKVSIDSVLFDENGALPHGGLDTGGKVLTYDSVVTMEIGVHHLGYSSDVARSFSIDGPNGKSSLADRGGRGSGAAPKDPQAEEKELVWRTVAAAQDAARKAMVSNGTAADVDLAARSVIEHAGYGYAFPHRVGHGVGVRAHEAPYLNKFNKYERLQPGMILVIEPGIYLEQRFGVRLGDVYLVKEDGEEPELLSGRLSQGLDEP